MAVSEAIDFNEPHRHWKEFLRGPHEHVAIVTRNFADRFRERLKLLIGHNGIIELNLAGRLFLSSSLAKADQSR